MQGQDQGAGGGVSSAEGGPGDTGSSDGPGGLQDHRMRGGRETVASPTRVPLVPWALQGPGLVGDPSLGRGGPARSTAEMPGRPLFYLNLTMPLPSPVQAEIARQFLAPRILPHPGAVSRELVVSANFLMIRLTAEDPGQLQIAMNSCLHQFCVFIGIMPNILYPVFYLLP